MYVCAAADKNIRLCYQLHTAYIHYQSVLPPEGKGKHFEAVECIVPDGADIPTSQVRSGQVDGRRRTRNHQIK